MGRKPKPPPAILKVEMLDTGIDPTLRDELGDGEVIPQPEAKPPSGAMTSGEAYRAAQARAKQAWAGDLLTKLATKPKPFRRRI